MPICWMLVSLALFLGPVTPAAEAATVLRWAETSNPNDPRFPLIDRVARRVAETSQGRVTIQVVTPPDEALGRDRVEGVALGAQEMTSVSPAPVAQDVPAFGVTDAPYVWRDAAHLLKVMSGPIGEDLSRELVQKRGIRVLGATHFGARHVSMTDKPIRAASDMRGVRLQVPNNAVFRALAGAWEATPVPMRLEAFPMAVKQKLVDGGENLLTTVDSRKFYESQKYLVLTGHMLMPRLVLINEKAWQGLDTADQKALAAAVAEGLAWQNQEIEARDKALLAKLKQSGMEVIQPDVESFRKPVVAAMPGLFDSRWGAGLYQRIIDAK